MDNERELVYFKMLLLQAEIEMQGMIAENKIRELNGQALDYGDKDFFNLIDKYGIHNNAFPYYKD